MTTTQNGTHSSRHIVLVSLALDETSDWALIEGARLAREHEAGELHVVHAVNPADSLGALNARLQQAPLDVERRIESLWEDDKPLEVVGHIGVGDPATLVLRTAADVEADVIVVGSHRRRGLDKWLNESVAERILQGAHCSVLVALPRDYASAEKPRHVDPPCAECQAARTRPGGTSYWCERHAKSYVTPHVYRPRDSMAPAQRNSIPGML